MLCRYGKASLCLAVMLLFVAAIPSAQASPFVRTTWLNITTFNLTAHNDDGGHDVFVLKGSFNLAPDLVDPAADVTLTLGTRDFSYPSGALVRVGTSNKYRGTADGITAQIEYGAGGTSRCNFTFIGVRQALPDYIDDPEHVDMRLQIGADFDEIAYIVTVVRFTRTTATAKLLGFLNQAGQTCIVDSIRVTRNTNKQNADSIAITLRLYNTGFDPHTDDITFSLGAFHVTMPHSYWRIAANGLNATCNGILGTGEKMTATYKSDEDRDVIKCTFKITGVDLSSFTNPADLAVSTAGSAPWGWVQEFDMKANANQTLYTY